MPRAAVPDSKKALVRQLLEEGTALEEVAEATKVSKSTVYAARGELRAEEERAKQSQQEAERAGIFALEPGEKLRAALRLIPGLDAKRVNWVLEYVTQTPSVLRSPSELALILREIGKLSEGTISLVFRQFFGDASPPLSSGFSPYGSPFGANPLWPGLMGPFSPWALQPQPRQLEKADVESIVRTAVEAALAKLPQLQPTESKWEESQEPVLVADTGRPLYNDKGEAVLRWVRRPMEPAARPDPAVLQALEKIRDENAKIQVQLAEERARREAAEKYTGVIQEKDKELRAKEIEAALAGAQHPDAVVIQSGIAAVKELGEKFQANFDKRSGRVERVVTAVISPERRATPLPVTEEEVKRLHEIQQRLSDSDRPDAAAGNGGAKENPRPPPTEAVAAQDEGTPWVFTG